jgi:hypothetical protein
MRRALLGLGTQALSPVAASSGGTGAPGVYEIAGAQGAGSVATWNSGISAGPALQPVSVAPIAQASALQLVGPAVTEVGTGVSVPATSAPTSTDTDSSAATGTGDDMGWLWLVLAGLAVIVLVRK